MRDLTGRAEREGSARVLALGRILRYFKVNYVTAALFYGVDYRSELAAIGVLNEKVKSSCVGNDEIFKLCQHELSQNNDCRCDYSSLEVARAAAQTDDRRRPKSRRCGKSLYLTALGNNYRTRADKSDTRDDLRAKTGGVGEELKLKKQILAGERGHSRAKTDKYMSTEARGAALSFALNTYYSAADHGERQTDSYGKPTEVSSAKKIQTFKHVKNLLTALLCF
jgi:hypothetical protein